MPFSMTIILTKGTRETPSNIVRFIVRNKFQFRKNILYSSGKDIIV